MAYLQLPTAFRSLSRLSSALSAKASSLRSYFPDHFYECIALHSGRFKNVTFFSSLQCIEEVFLDVSTEG